MKIQKDDHGYSFGNFSDLNGAECQVHDSSLATNCAIWIGVNIPRGRMLLSRKQVAYLIPFLRYFVVNGYIGNEDGSKNKTILSRIGNALISIGEKILARA